MLLQAMAGMILAGIVMGRRLLSAPFAWLQGKSDESSNGEAIEHADEVAGG